jgi:hypothetical protein
MTIEVSLIFKPVVRSLVPVGVYNRY